MAYIDVKECRLEHEATREDAPAIYVIDMVGHRFQIDQCVEGVCSNVVSVPVSDWDDALTPWVAPGLYEGDADFGACADETLAQLVDEVIPTFEQAHGLRPSQRAVCGYSLGGLFSLYAFTHADAFASCAALSPSVWYEGWIDALSQIAGDFSERFAFLSIGKKEKRAMPAILHCVEDNVVRTSALLADLGCQTQVEIGPGNHMQHIPERMSAGLRAVDAFFGGDNPVEDSQV